MTEYDYSPAAWEQHRAKQASIAQWTANLSERQHEFTNPFKPSPEEISRAKESEFYDPDEAYEGPDRPPTPTSFSPPPPPLAKGQAGYGGAGYGNANASGSGAPPGAGPPRILRAQLPRPIVCPPSGRVAVPRWTGSGWVYEVQACVSPPRNAKHGVSPPSVKSGRSSGGSSRMREKERGLDAKRPSPVKSHTLPPFYVPAYPSAQQHPGYQPQLQRRNTGASAGGAGMALETTYRQPLSAGTSLGSSAASYVGYGYTGVGVNGATRKMAGNRLRKNGPLSR